MHFNVFYGECSLRTGVVRQDSDAEVDRVCIDLPERIRAEVGDVSGELPLGLIVVEQRERDYVHDYTGAKYLPSLRL